MKEKQFYKFDYVPNKLAYVYEVGEDIKFLAFFKCLTSGNMTMKAHKHTSNNPKDFKKIANCFKPTEEIKNLINEALLWP